MDAFALEENRIMELPLMGTEIDKIIVSKKPFIADDFYLSGSEVISFKRNAQFALKTVLSSAVSFNDELLIVDQEKDCSLVKKQCESYQLSYSFLNRKNEVSLMDELLRVITEKRTVSHVLKVVSSCYINIVELSNIAKICEDSGIDLILYCDGDLNVGVSELLDLGAAFIIYAPNNNLNDSLIIAKRRSLVKTEGKSSSFRFDLHAYWQKLLRVRGSFIKPMTV